MTYLMSFLIRYQLLGRRNFLHSRGGPQQCRGLQCDGCRAPASPEAVRGLQTLLSKYQLLSDAGAEANEAEGSDTDLALLNARVALRGCERALLLMTKTLDGTGVTGQAVLLRNEPGVSVRECENLCVRLIASECV